MKAVIDFEEETKFFVCEKCGKKWHFENAKYCGMRGTKLKKVNAPPDATDSEQKRR